MFGNESTFLSDNALVEDDIGVLLGACNISESAANVKQNAKPTPKGPTINPKIALLCEDETSSEERDEETISVPELLKSTPQFRFAFGGGINSLPELSKPASKLGSIFSRFQDISGTNSDQFSSLLVSLHRPLSVIYLHHPGHIVDVFKFDTAPPVVFKNLPQAKPKVPPLPKARSRPLPSKYF